METKWEELLDQSSKQVFQPGQRKTKRKLRLDYDQPSNQELLFSINPPSKTEIDLIEPTIIQEKIDPPLIEENIEQQEDDLDLGPAPSRRRKKPKKTEEIHKQEYKATFQLPEKPPQQTDSKIEIEEQKEGKETIKALSFSEIDNMRDLLKNPISRGKVLHCTIRRDKSGLSRFFPQYDVYLSQGFKYMMSSKKRSGSTSSNYAFSMNKTDVEATGQHCLAKLRSNFMGSLFNLYDNGMSYKKTSDPQRIRKNLATIEYQTNIFGTNGPRKMRMYMPTPTNTTEYRQMQQEWDLKIEFDKGNYDIKRFINKPPKWNEQMKAYVLNFNGRVDKPSVKNFIMVEEGREDENLLLFGRVGQDLFNMDIRYPLSPIQAFGIVVSSFDGKLICE